MYVLTNILVVSFHNFCFISHVSFNVEPNVVAQIASHPLSNDNFIITLNIDTPSVALAFDVIAVVNTEMTFVSDRIEILCFANVVF
jgi:hypothetical protein